MRCCPLNELAKSLTFVTPLIVLKNYGWIVTQKKALDCPVPKQTINVSHYTVKLGETHGAPRDATGGNSGI